MHSAGTPILNGLVAIFVQAFFAWRIYKIGKDNPFMKPISVIIALLGLLQLAASIALGIAFLQIGTDATSLPKLSKIIPIHLGANMVADMLITICMFVILYDFKQNTSLPRTRTLLSALIRNTVENGLITSGFAITNLVLYFTRKTDLTSVAFRWTIGFIYAIVLLTTLNRREEHRGDHVESGFGFATVELTNLELSIVNGRSRYGDQTIGHSTTSLPASTVPHDERSAHDSLTVNEPGCFDSTR
ncbi:hypothetical protein FA13DRAFT_714667 [Coprinellus micaceus]|uniref:DUF6534 domain-containing protein n=1 Tax=Coprinellus micaceus TaxID=71717 RepID=A0A4Y7TVQ3_COPMI|nr:hypothetical protein FA13DRAFT_714667 [Coprinellus micaceus]